MIEQHYGVICVTTELIPGRNILEVLDLVCGASYSQNTERETGKKTFFGLKNKTRPFNHTDSFEARMEALRQMSETARQIGANAVIGLKFDTATIASSYPYGGDLNRAGIAWGTNTTEYFAYGTAVVVE